MKPHAIADELLLPTDKQIAPFVIGEEYVNKLNGIYISLDTVFRRKADISADILDQMIQKIKSSTFRIFSIQFNESTDAENGSQLLVYARYIHDSILRRVSLL
ncbi:Protein ZBED8 [Thelohanellus kitauei]|nr:Protein ZBED8 [Thelohanellus kitauei]